MSVSLASLFSASFIAVGAPSAACSGSAGPRLPWQDEAVIKVWRVSAKPQLLWCYWRQVGWPWGRGCPEEAEQITVHWSQPAFTHWRSNPPNESNLCLLTLPTKHSWGICPTEPMSIDPSFYTLWSIPLIYCLATEFQGGFLSSLQLTSREMTWPEGDVLISSKC